jgi:hypothetical protein
VNAKVKNISIERSLFFKVVPAKYKAAGIIAIAAKADEVKIIFVDGERVGDDLVDEDQLLSIEAYEIALDIIKRNSESKEIELESLLFSIGLLENVNKTRAIEYTIRLLKDKYNIDYNNDLSDIDVTDEEIDRYIDMLKD